MIFRILSPTEITVPLPRNFNRGTMYGLIDKVLDPDLNARCSRVKFDFTNLQFIHPTGITVLSNLIEYLYSKDVKIQFANHSVATRGNKFLDDAGFFTLYIKKSVFPQSKLRDTTLPLAHVRHERSFSWIEDTFTPWLSARVELSAASFSSIGVCLKEIFNNIDDHSGEKVGCVFAQHFPNKNELELSISDFGVGIPTNVRKVQPELTDSRAISAAVAEGFTTKSTDRNQGAGLDILTKYVVLRNRGSVIVHSLKGSFSCTYSDSGMKKTPRDVDGYYPGTLFQIGFRTNVIEDIGAKEEFEW